jgi:hypothetical protein
VKKEKENGPGERENEIKNDEKKNQKGRVQEKKRRRNVVWLKPIGEEVLKLFLFLFLFLTDWERRN